MPKLYKYISAGVQVVIGRLKYFWLYPPLMIVVVSILQHHNVIVSTNFGLPTTSDRIFYLYIFLCLVLIIIIYLAVYGGSISLYSYSQLKDFSEEFVLDGRYFEIIPIKKDAIKVDWEREFPRAQHIVSVLRNSRFNNVGEGQKYSFANPPLLFFYAKPLGKKYLKTCKAYLFPLSSTYIIVSRTKDVNRNSFEKFLFFHEFEHINDNGASNFRTLARVRIEFVFHSLVLISCITSLQSLYFFILYLASSAFYWGCISTARREFCADSGALLKLGNENEIKTVITILKDQFKKNKTLKKGLRNIEYNFRIKALENFEKNLSGYLKMNRGDQLLMLSQINDADDLAFLKWPERFVRFYSIFAGGLLIGTTSLSPTYFIGLLLIFLFGFILIAIRSHVLSSFTAMRILSYVNLTFDTGDFHVPEVPKDFDIVTALAKKYSTHE